MALPVTTLHLSEHQLSCGVTVSVWTCAVVYSSPVRGLELGGLINAQLITVLLTTHSSSMTQGKVDPSRSYTP